MGDGTARRFMRVFHTVKSDNVSDLTVSALYKLAAPSTPEAVREAVTEHVAAGGTVSVAGPSGRPRLESVALGPPRLHDVAVVDGDPHLRPAADGKHWPGDVGGLGIRTVLNDDEQAAVQRGEGDPPGGDEIAGAKLRRLLEMAGELGQHGQIGGGVGGLGDGVHYRFSDGRYCPVDVQKPNEAAVSSRLERIISIQWASVVYTTPEQR